MRGWNGPTETKTTRIVFLCAPVLLQATPVGAQKLQGDALGVDVPEGDLVGGEESASVFVGIIGTPAETTSFAGSAVGYPSWNPPAYYSYYPYLLPPAYYRAYRPAGRRRASRKVLLAAVRSREGVPA